MSVEHMQRLYNFNAWANRRVLESCAKLSAAQFTQPLGSSFSSVRDTLAHILGAEWIWLERWHGRSPSALPPAADFPTLDAVAARWSEVQAGIARFVGALTPEKLESRITYTNLQGQPFTYTLRDMLVHVVNHGSYHRGQLATLLRQLGAQPLPTDFLWYLDVLDGTAPS
jgi:uncharacterized damage-inducible protein DinB